MLLTILPLVPLAGAGFLSNGRALNIPLLTSTLLLILSGFGLRSVFTGDAVALSFPLPGPYQPSFYADALTVLFVLLTVFLWLVVALYTPDYMKQEGGTGRFALCTLLTLAAVLGLFRRRPADSAPLLRVDDAGLIFLGDSPGTGQRSAPVITTCSSALAADFCWP